MRSSSYIALMVRIVPLAPTGWPSAIAPPLGLVFSTGNPSAVLQAADLADNELLAEIRLPILDNTWHLGFTEFARRAGDFALAMALTAIKLDDGKIVEARIGIGAIEDRPIRIAAAEQVLIGEVPSPELFTAVAELAGTSVDPTSDLHASAEYRRDLTRAMTCRALNQAFEPRSAA